MALSTIAALAAIGASGYGVYQASQSGGHPGGTAYIPNNLLGADKAWTDALSNQIYGINQAGLGQIPGYLAQIWQQQKGLPYSGYQQLGAQAGEMYPAISAADMTAAGLMGGLGGQAIGQGQNIYGQGQQMYRAGQGVLNTAMDPQNALYQRTAQQVQDQTRAAESARGIAMTPYGAGLESQAMSDFNINWQNAQLARQLQGMQAASQGYGAAGQGYGATLQGNQLAGADYTQMLQMMGQAPQNLLAGGRTPISVGQDIAAMQTGASNQFASGVGSAMAPWGAVQAGALPYMTYGTGAGANAYAQFAGQQQFNANQQAMGMQGLTQGLNAFSGTPTGAGVNNWLGGLFGSGGGNTGAAAYNVPAADYAAYYGTG